MTCQCNACGWNASPQDMEGQQLDWIFLQSDRPEGKHIRARAYLGVLHASLRSLPARLYWQVL